MEDIKRIEAQVKVVAAEHDAAIEKFKQRIAELEEQVQTEIRSREALEEDIAQEKEANGNLVSEIRELKRRAEASIN